MENLLGYKDFSNEQIAKIVAYAVSSDCEKAKRRFMEEFGIEAPPARTILHWKKDILKL